MQLEGVRVVVAGLWKSGLASVELLARRGARVTGVDLNPLDKLPGAAETLDRCRAAYLPQSDAAFDNADLIVLSPGVPADLPALQSARARGVKVIGEVELAGWFLQGPVLGITGTNGKTTTTALTGHLLHTAGVPAQVGGNIGSAVTGMVDASTEDQWNVLELSSFQLETTETFRCRIGVALNLTPDHLDRHYTMENYVAAKGRMFVTQQPGDFAVLNAADNEVAGYARLTRGTPVWFGPREDAACRFDGEWIWLEGSKLLPPAEMKIRGPHNVENAMAAALAAHLAGASREGIAAGLISFTAVEHRLEFVRRVAGVDYYNDSKATNVDSTLKALGAFPGGLWVILGGKDKNSDYTPLNAPLKEKARAALLIGAAADKIAAQLDPAIPRRHTGTIGEALTYASAHARPGDTVLLAPACASFDQFQNYEQRGRVFKQLVASLAGEET